MVGIEKWYDGIPDQVRRLAGRARSGMTDQEVADHLGVTIRTIHRWKKTHPEFKKALIETKAILDSRVELSLYRVAIGYSYTEVEVTLEGGVVTKRVERTKEVPPNVAAIRFWLTNRDPENWCDRQAVDYSGAVDVSIRNMSDEDIKRAICDAAATLGSTPG